MQLNNTSLIPVTVVVLADLRYSTIKQNIDLDFILGDSDSRYTSWNAFMDSGLLNNFCVLVPFVQYMW